MRGDRLGSDIRLRVRAAHLRCGKVDNSGPVEPPSGIRQPTIESAMAELQPVTSSVV